MLMGSPSFPKLHRRAGRGPFVRARIKTEIEIKYVDNIMTRAAEPIALKAVVDPMLISDKRHVIRNVSSTEFNGIFQPGRTCDIVPEKGRPLSRAKAQVWRETVATVEMQAEVILTMIKAVSIDAPAYELVEL
jgi:hypothetical protein